jgi:hypothetical protein
LVAASAVAAGDDFFNTDASNPPQRVGGPPFNTATALVNGTAANTVDWYLGDDATDDPRSTAVARADQSLTVTYGARANEQALRFTVQSIAVYAAVTYSAVDPNAAEQDAALRDRLYVPSIRRTNSTYPTSGANSRALRSRSRAPRSATSRPIPRCRICCKALKA